MQKMKRLINTFHSLVDTSPVPKKKIAKLNTSLVTSNSPLKDEKTTLKKRTPKSRGKSARTSVVPQLQFEVVSSSK